jgi:hypothetical protein
MLESGRFANISCSKEGIQYITQEKSLSYATLDTFFGLPSNITEENTIVLSGIDESADLISYLRFPTGHVEI